MTDRPIIFSAPMVRALLDGRKSQTRRVLKLQPPEWVTRMTHEGRCGWIGSGDGHGTLMHVPYAVGDRLWVKEQCATWEGNSTDATYRATMGDDQWADMLHDARNGAPWKLRSPIHMPRWASRLTLIVTDVRVQRVQDISEADAVAEGVCETAFWERAEHKVSAGAPWSVDRLAFADLWNILHSPEAWALNPWVCALTFTVHRQNIDQINQGDMK